MKKPIILLFIVFFSVSGMILAQKDPDSKQQTIFEALATADSGTHATVQIHQDKRIEELLVAKRSAISSHEQATTSGYRVQVFSSNTQRSAKAEAFKIEKQILEAFPEQGVYVNYSSPFWKVRVGDFKTQAEAHAFRSQLIESFPSLRSGTYIVHEQINISGSK
jgi:SPOR domain